MQMGYEQVRDTLQSGIGSHNTIKSIKKCALLSKSQPAAKRLGVNLVLRIISRATVDEQLECKPEPRNKDPYADAVMKNYEAVGLVPRKLSAACTLFIKRGIIDCIVTGIRRYSCSKRTCKRDGLTQLSNSYTSIFQNIANCFFYTYVAICSYLQLLDRHVLGL